MRSIEITKDEFDDTFFPTVTSGRTPAKNEDEHEIALRLIRYLKNPSLTYPEDPKPVQIAAIEESGNRWWPSYYLNEDEAILEFEEDVFKVVRHRFKEQIPHTHPMMAEEFDVVWQKIKAAESYEVGKDEEEQDTQPELEATG